MAGGRWHGGMWHGGIRWQMAELSELRPQTIMQHAARKNDIKHKTARSMQYAVLTRNEELYNTLEAARRRYSVHVSVQRHIFLGRFHVYFYVIISAVWWWVVGKFFVFFTHR